ncbi:nucleotidyltransferase domain-containing protein [Taibaiella koreensis]|uniref:nucleotidyltransferase domain-containing protein n=1 Tax=Taibaiella koreensis TaxID=1268548 RepID=UPI000E59FD97|nr:nucleotidyltransferase domain-containing protein [Taibaiella koreensis]
MRTRILDQLKTIEQEKGIQILFACESGSRGWEFPSPDSDYDVRFIYRRPYTQYLSISVYEEQLSFPIDSELDLSGWDLRKTLQLIQKSNTTPFEWLQSPIVYRETPGFRDELWLLCQHYFSRRSNVHHYLGIAKGALDTMENGMIKIKKLFYVLRPLLAALWNVEQNGIAPMSIQPLMNLMPDALQQKVTALIALKSGTAEGYTIAPDESMMEWIGQTFEQCTRYAGTLPRDHFDAGRLDDFFRQNLTENDNSRNKR